MNVNGMNIYKALYTCILIIPVIALCIFPVRDYLKRRMSSLILASAIRFVLFLFVAILIACITTFPTKFVISISAGIYFLYFYWKEVELPFNKILFLFLTAYMVSCFSRILGTLADIVLHPENTYYDISLEGFLFQLVFLVLMDVILYLPFTRKLGWLIAHFHSESVWNCICIFPLLCSVATYILIPHNYSWMHIGRAFLMYIACVVCLAVLIVALYILFYRFVHTYIERQKLEHANEILSIQSAQYQQLLRSVQENSRIRHDFRHQLVVISEFLKQKDYETLENYVSTYIQNTETEIRVYTYSPALNAVLSYYESLCRDKEIRPDFSLRLPPSLSIDDQDFCVMLGNLLENAVYGCESVKDPVIKLKIMQTAPNMLAVRISNPYTGTPKNVNGAYLSSRHSGFGQGLESVRFIAEKYHGCMEVQSEESVFTVKILLQLPAAEEAAEA